MNIFDIISLVAFIAFIVVCACRGLLRIVAGLGAFLVASLLSRLLASLVGVILLENLLGIDGEVWVTVLSLVLFVVLFILLKKMFSSVANALTKFFHAGVFDKILGGVFGFFAGGAFVSLFMLSVCTVAFIGSAFGADALSDAVNESFMFTFFMW